MIKFFQADSGHGLKHKGRVSFLLQLPPAYNIFNPEDGSKEVRDGLLPRHWQYRRAELSDTQEIPQFHMDIPLPHRAMAHNCITHTQSILATSLFCAFLGKGPTLPSACALCSILALRQRTCNALGVTAISSICSMLELDAFCCTPFSTIPSPPQLSLGGASHWTATSFRPGVRVGSVTTKDVIVRDKYFALVDNKTVNLLRSLND